jgi:hypothetical protein
VLTDHNEEVLSTLALDPRPGDPSPLTGGFARLDASDAQAAG